MEKRLKYISKGSDLDIDPFSLSNVKKPKRIHSIPSSMFAIAFVYWQLMRYDPRLITSVSRTPTIKIPAFEDCNPLGFYITINWIESGKMSNSYRYELLSIKTWGLNSDSVTVGHKIVNTVFMQYAHNKKNIPSKLEEKNLLYFAEYRLKISSIAFFTKSY